jgi:hypothetical protein
MTMLTRTKSGSYMARKVIPKDVRQAHEKLYGVGWEIRLTLPAHLTEPEATAQYGEWLAEIETRIQTLRATAKGKGQPLTQKQAHALAGLWYRWFTQQHEANPGDPKHWRDLYDLLIWDVIHPEAPDEYHENPKADPSWEWAKAPEVREAIRPMVAQEARVASFLVSEGIVLSTDAYALFVDAVSDNLLHALPLLARWAAGDYAPDETPLSFPEWHPGEPAAAASAHTNPETTAERARRWVPWLLAYTGARAGEITQLRGSDVGEHEGVLAVHLTPDAGTMKTNEARWVPIHEHLVDQGFLEFVVAGGTGPLFYDPPKNVRVKDKLKPSTAPAQIVRMRLGEWTREIGIVGKVSPLHAWRHTFQRVADRAGIPEKISDAIVGHKPANIARTYGAPSLGDMASALKRFPRFKLTET